MNQVREAEADLKCNRVSPLRILHLEDDPRDAELVQATLEGDGVVCHITRVDTPSSFRTSLEEGEFGLVLADYTLPSFDGISALKLAKEIAPGVPFIFVTGTLGEDVAIEALKLGATDYVSKNRLSRMVPSVRRALREADERSQRQLAEQMLRESEAYLAEAQRLSQTGSWAWNPQTGDIRYWSEECFRVLGFDPLEPLPRFEEFLPHVHPDDRAHVRESFEQFVREKADFELDYRVVNPVAGVRDIHAVGRAVLGPTSELVEFVGTVIDVTDRKRAEQELQQLVDFLPQIILVLQADGKFIYVNRVAREYTGMTLEEYRAADLVTSAVHPDDAAQVREFRLRAFSANVPFEHETRLLRKDGVYRWFLFRYTPLIKHGSVIRWLATATEIESRKQEEERVRKENVRLEERTRIAQELHDTLLQTFLSASMQLDIALEEVSPGSPVKPRLDRVLQVMRQGIEEGRKAIQNLRSFDLEPQDLAVALSSVREELAVDADIDFRLVVTGHEEPLNSVIRHEVYRIGKEALTNALSHSRAKRVELQLEYSDNDFRMRISDDGCGIDPEVLRSGRNGHWGLEVMHERATKIGGMLSISSSEDEGTEVRLSVPRAMAFVVAPEQNQSA